MAETPEESTFTGARERIVDLQESLKGRPERGPSAKNIPANHPTHRWERSRNRRCSGWLSPLEINERSDPVGPDASGCGRRASLKGFLSISLTRYLELLDWTGRQLRSGKRGAIPNHLAPILSRLGIDTDGWCDLVGKFGRLFKRAAGGADALSREADRRGQRWMQAPGMRLLTGG